MTVKEGLGSGPGEQWRRPIYLDPGYLLDHHTGGKPGQWDDGPANDTKLGVHILPMAFPWT